MANFGDRITDKEIQKIEQHHCEIMPFNAHRVSEKLLHNNKDFFCRLKSSLKRMEMRQADLAREAGLSEQSISVIYSPSIHHIRYYHLYLFAAILKCTPDYLLGIVDQPTEYTEESIFKEEPRIPVILPDRFAEDVYMELVKSTAIENPVFADYICQIVKDEKPIFPEQTKIDVAKKLFYLGRFVDKPKFIGIPQTWRIEYQVEEEKRQDNAKVKNEKVEFGDTGTDGNENRKEA